MSIAYFTVPNNQHQVSNIATAMDSRDLEDHDIINIETVNADTLVKVWFRQFQKVPSSVKVTEIDKSESSMPSQNASLITSAGHLVAAFGAPDKAAEATTGFTSSIPMEVGEKFMLRGELNEVKAAGPVRDMKPQQPVRAALKVLPNARHRR